MHHKQAGGRRLKGEARLNNQALHPGARRLKCSNRRTLQRGLQATISATMGVNEGKASPHKPRQVRGTDNVEVLPKKGEEGTCTQGFRAMLLPTRMHQPHLRGETTCKTHVAVVAVGTRVIGFQSRQQRSRSSSTQNQVGVVMRMILTVADKRRHALTSVIVRVLPANKNGKYHTTTTPHQNAVVVLTMTMPGVTRVNALVCGWIFNVLSFFYSSYGKGLEKSHKYWNLLIFFVNLRPYNCMSNEVERERMRVCENIAFYDVTTRTYTSIFLFLIYISDVRENRKYTEDRILRLLQK